MQLLKKKGLLYGVGFIFIASIITFISIATIKPINNGPSDDIKSLDNKLLTDLKSQEISIEDKSKCMMTCLGIDEDELKALFDLNNVNYRKCEPGNCHYTSYTIEGKISSGEQVSFIIDSGEDGNVIRSLKSESNCNCS